MSSSDPLEKFLYLIRPCPGYINRGENASLLFGDSAAVHSLGSLDLFYSAPCQPLAAIITLASQVFCRQKWHEVWWPSPLHSKQSSEPFLQKEPSASPVLHYSLWEFWAVSGAGSSPPLSGADVTFTVFSLHCITPCSLPLEKCGCFCPLIISCLFK